MTNEEYKALYDAANVADDVFQAELERQFGKKNAADARYSPALFDDATRAANQHREALTRKWLAAMAQRRGETIRQKAS